MPELEQRFFDQPCHREVALVLQRGESVGRWQQESWNLEAVISHQARGESGELVPLESARFLLEGLQLGLHRDECESYYHNLRSDSPSLYLVARCESDQPLEPLLVTASFDEAAAYHEVEDEVFPVAMPADIHSWIEGFVLAYYVPELKRKRRLDQREKEQRHV